MRIDTWKSQEYELEYKAFLPLTAFRRQARGTVESRRIINRRGGWAAKDSEELGGVGLVRLVLTAAHGEWEG
jgi:hypothetical protein